LVPGLAVSELGAGETSTELRGSLALTSNVAGRHAGATLAADATELDEVDPPPPPLVAEPQPASTSAAVAASAAPTEPARLTGVLIRLIPLASLGVGLTRLLAVCPCGGHANFPCP
jgi:hypothetical protein